jgi:hypothetical protein
MRSDRDPTQRESARRQAHSPMIRLASLVCLVLAMLPSIGRAQQPPVFGQPECMTVADRVINVRFGYTSFANGILAIPSTPEDNIFIGGIINPVLGQPQAFVPGTFHDVFRADFDLAESPSYSWVLAGRIVRIRDNLPLCRDPDRPQIIGLLECVQPPGPGNPLAQARFGYINTGAQLNLPLRSSRNFFGAPTDVYSPAALRGQPTSFAPGLQRGVFTVSFDAESEPLLLWQIDGVAVPAALGLPGVPLCTPLATTVFDDGFEASA